MSGHGYRSWLVIRYRATNDANGNPRRVLVGLCGDDERVIDEGYRGDGSWVILAAFGPWAHYYGYTVDVTPRQYREFAKRAVTS